MLTYDYGSEVIVPEREDYIKAFKTICRRANGSGYSLDLADTTPGRRVDEKFTISYGVGGLCKLVVDPALYDELKAELAPLMRKILRTEPENGQLEVTFYPVASIDIQ